MQFVHLGIHTEFSITESIVRIPDLIKAAVNESMPALALTDLSNLHAAVKFYESCLSKGIKPILLQMYFVVLHDVQELLEQKVIKL